MRRRGKTAGMLALLAAVAAVDGLWAVGGRPHYLSPDGDAGGGGGGSGAGDDGKGKGKQKEEKLTLTQAELDAKIAEATKAALAAATKEAEDKRKAEEEKAQKERQAEEAKKAKEANDFQKLYESESARAKAMEQQNAALALQLRKQQVESRLQQVVAKNHPDYLASVEWISPKIVVDKADLSDADADKQIKEVVAAFVKDNPRKQSLGAPGSPARGKMAAGQAEPPEGRNNKAPLLSSTAARSF